MMKRPAMHTIHLHGNLAKFGPAHSLAVNTPLEAIRALAAQIEGFAETMREGAYRLVRGDVDTGMHYVAPYDAENNSYEIEMLDFSLGPAGTDFHIVPVLAGAGGGGGKAILGAVIMVAAVVASPFTAGSSFGVAMSTTAISTFGITYGGIFAFGAALTLAGIGSMLQPSVKTNYSQNESPDQRASFFMGGQVNQSSQGGPVIMAYGHCRVGSTVISAGLSTERV